MAIALHHSRAKGAARLILVGIANHDGDGGAWPSIATLAKYANTTERSAQRAITELCGLGEVERHVQQGGTHRTPDWGRPNLYRFLLRCPAGCDRTKNHRVVDNSREGVTQASPGDVGVTRGVTQASPGGVTQASPEPSIEPPTNSTSVWSSTSPAEETVCWACGQPKAKGGAMYCTDCSNR